MQSDISVDIYLDQDISAELALDSSMLASVEFSTQTILQNTYNIMIKDPQIFNPDSGQVTANTADFTLADSMKIAMVSINGQVISSDEYSLAGAVVTVTPANGFFDTSDQVLIFQHDTP